MSIHISDEEAHWIVSALEPHYPDGIPNEVVEMLASKYRKFLVDKAIWDLVMSGELTMKWQEDDWALTLRSQL